MAYNSPLFKWAVTTLDATMVVNNGYIANKAGLLTLTLPVTSAVGDMLIITGKNRDLGWTIAQNAGQTIYYGTQATTTGVTGGLSSSKTRDTITLVCVTASLDWNLYSSQGNITFS